MCTNPEKEMNCFGAMNASPGMAPYGDVLTDAIGRVYRAGMTTTSGGNFSICDPDGVIWITPAGEDKGGLTPKDMVKVFSDGRSVGLHRASSELPIHRHVYQRRKDLKAVIHAHPPALVAFAMARQVPDLSLIPLLSRACGKVGFAEYRLPGSDVLGLEIAKEFAQGADVVIMGDHGVAVGGSTMLEAYQRLNAAEFCARALLDAAALGEVRKGGAHGLITHGEELGGYLVLDDESTCSAAMAASVELARMMERAFSQSLMLDQFGSMSKRLSGNDFMISGEGQARYAMPGRNFVWLRGGSKVNAGESSPDALWPLHQEIYRNHPDVGSVIVTMPASVTAHALARRTLDVTTNPESWVFVREVVSLPYDVSLEKVINAIGPETPAVLIEHGPLIVTGGPLMQTFDRLEVCEFTAKSNWLAHSLGGAVAMEDEKIVELQEAFCTT